MAAGGSHPPLALTQIQTPSLNTVNNLFMKCISSSQLDCYRRTLLPNVPHTLEEVVTIPSPYNLTTSGGKFHVKTDVSI